MILYRPTEGDVNTNPVIWRPRTCFLMAKLGLQIPDDVKSIRENVEYILTREKIKFIDANSKTTGKDFLFKIWQMIVSVPVGIAIIHDDITTQTMANIFFELGWMQALGKETLIIKTKDIKLPSDFSRTEYVEYDENFEEHMHDFIASLKERADYFALIAEQVENNPLLAIDYYRRAYLLTGNISFQTKSIQILKEAGIEGRAKSSVEMLLSDFALQKNIIKSTPNV